MKRLKVFSLVVMIIFSGLLIHGQQVVTRASTKIELIKRRIKKSKNDTVKIKLLQQWSDLVFITDPKKDLELQEEVINICTEHLKKEKIPYLQQWFKEQESMALDKTATSYYYDGNDKKALKFYTASCKILEDLDDENLLSIDNKYLLSSTCNKIARMYEGNGEFRDALRYYQKSMKLDADVQAHRNKEQSLQHLSDSILLVSTEIMHQKEINYQKEVTKQSEKNLFYISCSLFIFLILFVLVLRSWRKTKSQNKIIENQKTDIENQKANLEESHKEITDSINYAKNIQDALMTSVVYLKDVLPESFIFLKPKDVVSGDYYWVHKTNEDEVFFTVADCTGHGVPGAFMSMIGTSLLNEIIIEKEIKDTDKILYEMRAQIIKSLGQEQEGAQKDGMDISLCKLNMKNKTVEFSGAHNSLVHIRGEELKTYRGDHQPVGLLLGDKKPFTKHKVKLKKNDMLYIYSDGYQDQFGGEKGKKYMAAKFKNQLLKISKKTEDQQLSLLDKEFSSWIKDYEQVDDVCVMGVRII